MDALWLLEGESWDAVTWRDRESGGQRSKEAQLKQRFKKEAAEEPLTLNMHGMSLRLAWMTSDSKTELTENSSSLCDTQRSKVKHSGQSFFYLNLQLKLWKIGQQQSHPWTKEVQFWVHRDSVIISLN